MKAADTSRSSNASLTVQTMNRITLSAAVAAALACTAPAQAQSRDTISIVGSSTVYPFATVVAERFGRSTDFATPKIESTGSGGGLKLFCGGVGIDTPDITNSSRRIKASELEMCEGNGVTDVVEVLIGYDGIAIANSVDAPQYELSAKDLYLALARDVPNPDGEGLVANPYTRWSQIDANLPDNAIEVLGPPPTSGTRDAFVELVMDAGCEEFDAVTSLDEDAMKAACQTMREDGVYVEAGENDNLIVQKLEANPDALGIFGYSFLDQNDDKVQSSLMDGVAADFDTIADGSYPVSRPLYFYVKAQHAGTVPGIEEYVAEFTSEAATGEDGYLSEKGLIPLPDEERAEIRAAAEALEPMTLN